MISLCWLIIVTIVGVIILLLWIRKVYIVPFDTKSDFSGLEPWTKVSLNRVENTESPVLLPTKFTFIRDLYQQGPRLL